MEGKVDIDTLVSIRDLAPDSPPCGSLAGPCFSQLQLAIEQSTWSDDSSSASSITHPSPIFAREPLVTVSPGTVSHSWLGDTPITQQHLIQPSVTYDLNPHPVLITHDVHREHHSPRILNKGSVELPPRACTWDSSQYFNVISAVGDMCHHNVMTPRAMHTQMHHRASFQADEAHAGNPFFNLLYQPRSTVA